MAAPHVTGLAALIKQKYPSYNGSDLKYIITQNTTNLGFGINQQGKGMADASKIFNFNVTPVLSPTTIPKPTVTPTLKPTLTPTRIPTLTPTPTVTVTPTPALQKITIKPAVDAFVRSSQPGQNFGSSSKLENDSSPDEISYIRFTLTDLTGKSIKSAKLILWISDPTSASLSLRKADDSSWGESSITYNNRPAFVSTITSFNAKTVNTSITLDVTSAVNSRKGTKITLGIKSSKNDAGSFYSRNSSDSTKVPRLVVEYN
jgi:hypothetical protein